VCLLSVSGENPFYLLKFNNISKYIVYTSELHLVLWFTKANITMDDWKLKTSPVVRLERPNERFVDSQSQQWI